MGGRSRRQTVGYEYFMGMHLVACQAPVDGLTALSFNDRVAWEGFVTNGLISIDEPKLFGGDGREGGVGGYIDVEDGAPDQPQNDYLANNLRPGELVSAFRGVFALVFRRFYFGNNPYIKPMRLKVQNVYSTFSNWLPGLAGINGTYRLSQTALHMALDLSGSVEASELAAMKVAAKALVDTARGQAGAHIRVQPFSDQVETAIERFNCDDADLDAINAFIDGLTIDGGTDYDDGVSTAQQFFADAAEAAGTDQGNPLSFIGALTGSGLNPTENVNVEVGLRQVIVFISDGASNGTSGTAAATIAAIPGQVDVYTIGLGTAGDLADLDNTSADGVPVLDDTSDATQLSGLFLGGFATWLDINPIHMARDVLISPVQDGSGDVAEIGDTFAPAAQTMFDEGFGLSLFWQNTGDRDSFLKKIEQHISGVFYEDYITGKWEVQLIRGGDTSQFTFSDIKKWQEYDKPEPVELPNSVTLVTTRRDNGSEAAVTLHNVAALQSVTPPRVINEKVKLEGITDPDLRQKVLQRELLQRTIPQGKGAFYYPYLPTDVRQGRKITIDEPNMDINMMEVRVTEIQESDPESGEVLIRFAENVDETDLTEAAFISDDTGAVIDTTALASPVIFFEELSYFDQALARGQAAIDDDLALDPGIGSWQITGGQPNAQHLDAAVSRFDYPSFIDVVEGPLMPTWVLSAPLSRRADVTTFEAPETGRENELELGQLIQINGERMRLDGVSLDAGVATFTVGRACLDTVPAQHETGSYIMAWEGYAVSDQVDYSEAETITTRLQPRTATDTLALGSAADNVLTMDSRAFRPLPVGQLQVGGSYEPAGIQSGIVTVTWAHRSRVAQTTEAVSDHTAGDIGPEAGVSYHLVRRLIQNDGTVGYSVEEPLSPEQVTTVDVDLDDVAFSAYATPGTIRMEIGIVTKRETGPTYENWQTPFVPLFTSFARPTTFDTTRVRWSNANLTFDGATA